MTLIDTAKVTQTHINHTFCCEFDVCVCASVREYQGLKLEIKHHVKPLNGSVELIIITSVEVINDHRKVVAVHLALKTGVLYKS